MQWLELATGGAAIIAMAAAVRAMRREAALRRRAAALGAARADLLTLAAVAPRISGADWQRSVQTLLTHLVERGYVGSGTLFALSETGQFEVRATTVSGDPPDLAADPHAQDVSEHRELRCDRAAGTLYLPVLDESELIGLLHLTGFKPFVASSLATGQEEELALVRIVGAVMGLALASIRTFARQAALSSTDGLTGLYNHRHFQQLLGVALAQSYLQAEPLTLLLFDIDHFKRVNDTYGHLFGDLVLREVAYVMRRVTPSNAICARYGGEEMVVVLPGSSLEEGGRVAERLRQHVAEHQIIDFTSGARVTVTISVGVAAYELGQGKGRLTSRADEALYASKRGGRNMVTLAPMDGEPTAAEPRTL